MSLPSASSGIQVRPANSRQPATLLEIMSAFSADGAVRRGRAGCAGEVADYFQRRHDDAYAILLDELQRAKLGYSAPDSEDDAVAVAIRYLRAAREGAARLNLRLLAKVAAGWLKAGRLVAGDFLQCAPALEALSRAEVIFLAALARPLANQVELRRAPSAVSGDGDPWLSVKRALGIRGWDADQCLTVALRSLRSGLVIAVGNFGNLQFHAAPLLIGLADIIDFDDALRRER
jgi:hypothetical protein